MRPGSWGRALFRWFKGGNEPVTLGCCRDVGKRPEFMVGEKVGGARELVQAVESIFVSNAGRAKTEKSGEY